MKRLTTLLYTCVLTMLMALSPQSTLAQRDVVGSKTPPPRFIKQKISPAERKAQQQEFAKRYPLLTKMKKMQPTSTKIPKRKAGIIVREKASSKAMKNIMKVADGRELWGNVVYSDSWTSETEAIGMYSFNASSPVVMTPLGINEMIEANGGGAIVEDKFHCFYYFQYGQTLYLYHYAFDTETWETVIDGEDVTDYSLLATEMAVDNTTGTVYGQFFTNDLNGYEIGAIDFNTMTRTTIGTSTNTYVALGLANDNMLYGVASDGNLYKIDLATAAETLVGSTGVTVSTANGGYYGQSGEIDQKTNTFYWAAIDASGASTLYTVDLTTGAASKVGDFANEEQIYALTIPKPAAEDGAPAMPTNLKVMTDGGGLSCSVTAMAPTTTFGGEPLTGSLNYEIRINDEVVGTGPVEPGKGISRFIMSAPEGLNTFTVTVSNEVGVSPTAKLVKYIGYDTPKPVTDLNMTIGDGGNVSLTWTAPAEGVNNGYIENLRYNVTRYPDNVIVASNLSATSFSEVLSVNEMASYYYGVKAVSNGKESAEALSNREILGEAIIPPYSQTFDDETSADLFSIINANGDGSTWAYEPEYGSMQYKYHYANNGDDWLITPPLKLEPGRTYKVSFDVYAATSVYPERIEVMYGNGNNVEDMTNTLMSPTVITSIRTAPYAFSKEITVDEEQTVYIGFHAISDANMYNLSVDNIFVSEGMSGAAPDVVSGVEIIPDPSGATKATVKFNAPDKRINGESLSSLTKVEVRRAGELLRTFDAPQPGAALEFVDENTVNGVNTYTFVAYNEEGIGRELSASAYVGVDIPLWPENITIEDQTSSLKLAWEAPSSTGANGGIVVPEQLTYNVYDLVEGYYDLEAVYRDNTASTSYTIDGVTNEGEQALMQYGLASVNAAGTSEIVMTPVAVTGKPYDLPFRDSFTGGNLTYALWWISNMGSSSFNITTSMSADNDGGGLVFTPAYAGDVSYINTGKISLEGAKSPAIVFKHNAETGCGLVLDVNVTKPDGTTENVRTIDYTSLTETSYAHWMTEMIELDESYMSLPYIMVQFKVTVNEANSPLYIDDVNVRNVIAKDMEVTMEAPKAITKGNKATVKVKVENIGTDIAEGYSLSLLAGEEVVGELTESETLISFDSKTYEFEYTPSLFSETEKVTLKAQLDFNGDMDTDNNTVTTEVETENPEVPAPTNAKVVNKGRGEAEMTWTAPTPGAISVFEDFEDYEPWSIDNIGGWKMVDVDQASCLGLFQVRTYPHQGEAFAYIVFNPNNWDNTIIPNNPNLTPHSGEQYLAAIYGADMMTGAYVDLDNWLISPELSGTEQTISFWVSNNDAGVYLYPESFEVLYSTNGTDIADFVKIGDTHIVSGNAWEQVEVTLPAGAKHFAIHQITNSDNSFFFMVDDITYMEGSGEATGYNIYRDGQKVGSVTGESTSFTDTNVPDGTYTYAVTAVYAKGESLPAIAEPTVITGIGLTEAVPGMTYDVYTVDGKVIGLGMKDLKKLKPGVYVINNKKITVK